MAADRGLRDLRHESTRHFAAPKIRENCNGVKKFRAAFGRRIEFLKFSTSSVLHLVTRPSLVLFSRALCARMCAIAIALACPHPPRTHAPRPHTQTGPPVSATRPSLVLFSRALCARMCAIAIALAQQHPPPSPPAALPSLSPSSWLTTSSSPAFTSVRWSDSSTQAAASSIP